MAKRKKNEFDEFLCEQLKDPEFAKTFAEEKQKIDLAIKLAEIRHEAGLSQRELAERVGTSQSVIARMENPDYSGYSIRMLRRIATALGARIRIEFEPLNLPAHKPKRRSQAKA
jgi:ribosome-binding protein aMBF1 (putative translation factor)